jgi:hypothetical protein
MRRVGKLTGQILSCKMQLLVQIRSPFWAIGYIINDAMKSDKFPGAAFACVALQLHLSDDVIRDVHTRNYTRQLWRCQSLETLTSVSNVAMSESNIGRTLAKAIRQFVTKTDLFIFLGYFLNNSQVPGCAGHFENFFNEIIGKDRFVPIAPQVVDFPSFDGKIVSVASKSQQCRL